ncbi:GAF domain-containing protein [Hymenobacter siberiensis]|uniref:GAF domain-containing protein n=1 Tax=Hymenobacter siberiensis TaxID=2848396 RepID=UPI001C1E0365|nr:GAF domain-containing protein [Hymenobacter siberiensis]MBU6119420.1 GAF domain-containing protein [Hymenobacter siberiensis]
MANSYPRRPADEAHRLQALRPYQLITSIPNPLFDDLIRLTAMLFNVPIAIVALVEESTVQFRLNVGLPAGTAREPRDESLCSVAILQGDTTVFENLETAPGELAEPGFVQRMNLQFYAGSPLRTASGFPVGVLCVIDRLPRYFGTEEQALLERLSDIVIRLLDLRIQSENTDGSQPGSTLWTTLYDQIEASVNRLGTLAELAKWEESSETDAAVAYRTSTQEEIGRVVDALHEQLTERLH